MIYLLYPGNVKKQYKKTVSHANRGMNLEALVDETNKYYLLNDIAVIYKKPTPIAIKNTEYQGKKIKTTGFMQAKSTLDYVGLYKGKYLDFDVKSTQSKTSFPLSNISEHQLNHIRNIITHGGISFLIIEMNNQMFLLKGEDLIAFIDSEERKSVPYEYLKEHAYVIKLKINPKLDYLKIIDKIYFT